MLAEERNRAEVRERVRVDWMPVPRDRESVEMLASMLGPGDLARLSGFRNRMDMLRFMAGRACLRIALSGGIGCLPRDVPLRDRGAAAPALDCPEVTVAFSVSHAAEWAAAATGSVSVLGIDIEPICSSHGVAALARRAFSAREKLALEGVTAGFAAELASRIWVSKEAILKAAGCGLAMDPLRIELAVSRDGSLTVGSLPADLAFSQPIEVVSTPAPAGYVAALAVSSWSSGMATAGLSESALDEVML